MFFAISFILGKWALIEVLCRPSKTTELQIAPKHFVQQWLLTLTAATKACFPIKCACAAMRYYSAGR
jgi:hypothetical protein